MLFYIITIIVVYIRRIRTSIIFESPEQYVKSILNKLLIECEESLSDFETSFASMIMI